MSERFNRPRTPPGPPPSSNSRKTYGRGPASSAASSKSLTPKSYSDRSYDKYDKTYKSSGYQSSKDYPDDKYKSGKLSDKVTGGSKYASKNVYIDDNFKLGSGQFLSSQRYGESKDGYQTKYADKGRYGSDDKYSMTSTAATSAATSQYGNKKYDDYSTYPDKTSRYPKQDGGGSFYGSSYDSYGSYDGYGADRHRGGAVGGYGGDRVGVGPLSYGGGGRLGGGYGADKVGGGNLGYGGDKLGRGAGTSYGGEKHGRGGGGGGTGYGADKHGASNLGYGDAKPAVAGGRSRLYGDDDRRMYRGSYSPTRPARSDVRTYGGGTYDDYNYGTSSSTRASEKQYLDRYVIGDSVVYGPPGQYPRNLQSTSSPGRRPPSPPSPPLLSRNSYNRYSTTSPRRYSSGRRSLTPTTTAYRSLSPTNRRPPSPPSRRPPSPDSLYSRGRDRSYDSGRSKEGRYSNKTTATRSPLRDSARSLPDRRDDGRSRVDDRNRRDSDKRLNSREKDSLDSNKRPRLGDHRSVDYHSTSNTRGWGKDSYGQRDDRNQHNSPNRNVRRDSRTDGGSSRDRGGRRIEDRLSINPPSGSRRSPGARPRMGRNAASPRDGNKKPRRPDDLRLWIESRKNDGGKKGPSQGHGRPVGKGPPPRSGDRSKLKRPRLGDPKRRLGGNNNNNNNNNKARRTGGPVRRNKILKKYRRMAAKRGMRSGPASGAGSRNSNRSNRDGGGNRRGGEGGEGDHTADAENSKPGSTASIHRVIKKPSRVSLENNLEIRPRVMGRRTKKLLKDPKEEEDGSRIPSDGR
ncbi:serine/arginine repetitive matrix protein 2-like isoform X2 [Palaemon carinicauda]|uniref:serine/arginine repetitive matrix protein 2-like isoform X2 n=1 Tax=Palaemon carinicauda TaxID=392227 RepID=UPI0035B67E84